MAKAPLYTAAAIFIVVAVAHWLRFIFAIKITVGGVIVPMYPSLIAGIALLLLAGWLIKAARGT